MKKLLFLLSTLLVIGAGCTLANNKNFNQTTLTNTSTTLPTVNKAKVKTPQERSYDFCEADNNKIIIRFNEQTQTSQAFCRFADTTECDTLEYMAGRCAPGKGSKIYPTDTTPLTDCPEEQKVVCGANGKNYGNSCLAGKEKIAVAHEGPCTEEERLAKVPVTTPMLVPGKNNVATTGISNEKPDWLNMALSFITSAPAQNPRAFVDKCLINSKLYYYVYSSNAVLYNENGETVCYPNNDLNNSCPATLDFEFRKQNCLRLWLDNR